MSGIGDVAAEIRGVIAQLGEARARVDGALEATERAGQMFAHIGRTTSREELPRAVDACAGTAESMVRSMGHIDGAREELWNYLLIVAPSLAGPRPGHPVAERTSDRGDEPAPYLAAFFDGLRTRRRRGQPTDGVLTSVDGRLIADVHSGKRGPGAGASGLRPPWSQTMSILEHAEGHAAALVRTMGLAEATLYVNQRPCPGTGGCDRRLPEVLPEGVRLTVYGPDGFAKVYVGNGRGLA